MVNLENVLPVIELVGIIEMARISPSVDMEESLIPNPALYYSQCEHKTFYTLLYLGHYKGQPTCCILLFFFF